MKRRLDNSHSWAIRIVLALVFAIGLTFQVLALNTFSRVGGIFCQLIAFIFTAAPFFLPKKEPDVDIPLDCFVDRKEVITYVFDRLVEIVDGQSQDRFINIQCGPEAGTGKSELLREIKKLINSKKSLKDFFGEKTFKKYESLHSKIGSVHLVEWETNRTKTLLSTYQRTFLKNDVFLVDNVPIALPFEAPENDIIIFVSSSSPDIANENATRTLKPLKRKDISTYYQNLYNEVPCADLIDSILVSSEGNITKIKAILDKPESLESFKNNPDDLFQIQKLIREGNYPVARNTLNTYSSNIEKERMGFNYKLLDANLMHLENRYDESKAALNKLLQETKDTELQERVLERTAHVLKHQSKFDEAIEALGKLENTFYRAERSVSTDIMAYSFYEDDYYYRKFLEDLSTIEEHSASPIDEESYLTYRAIRSAYGGDKTRAIEEIDYAIEYYETREHRRLYNCYFIKGEILRHFSEYYAACEYYQKCIIAYKFNNDFDLYAMASLMIQYIRLKSDIKWKFDEMLSNEGILSISNEKSIPYIEKLCKIIIRLSKDVLEESKNLTASEYVEKYYFLIP